MTILFITFNLSCSTFKSHKWDSQRSVCWNQDAQREEDQKRTTELVSYLARSTAGSHATREKRQQTKTERSKTYDGTGAYYYVMSSWMGSSLFFWCSVFFDRQFHSKHWYATILLYLVGTLAARRLRAWCLLINQ